MITQDAHAETAREALQGAVDLYVHAKPDLLARRLDDIALATELKKDGLGAALHRHHFAPTAERARLASDATGFELYGALLLNGTAGGLEPRVVELALRMGARWVSLPSLSARRYQAGDNDNPYSRNAVRVAGTVPVVDDEGNLLPELHDIFDLVASNDVVLSLGYIDFAEAMAAVQAARRHKVSRIVATNPASIMGLSLAEMTELIAFPQVTFEFAASSARSFLGGAPALPPRDLVGLVRRFGVERCALSSDSGHAGAPTTYRLLSAVCTDLAAEGLTTAELRALVRDNPSRLIGLAG